MHPFQNDYRLLLGCKTLTFNLLFSFMLCSTQVYMDQYPHQYHLDRTILTDSIIFCTYSAKDVHKIPTE